MSAALGRGLIRACTARMTTDLVPRVLRARRATERLAAALSPEDCVAQSMPDASPVKWHLAHTTWFFERFVLRPLGVPPLHEQYDYLFNSYYESVGARQPRAERGLLTRPAQDEVMAYRRAVDARLADLERSPRLAEVATALELGKHHEEQHQELILTDVKHLFGRSPLLPAYRTDAAASGRSAPARPLVYRGFAGGLFPLGADAPARAGFAFDIERPRHRVHLAPFELAERLVTCSEYLAFMEDAGYARPELWLTEGFAWAVRERVRAPLYWLVDPADELRAETTRVFTLRGARALVPAEPVCHLTYYEADAYARWAGARLPTEAEWEVATVTTHEAGKAVDGALLEDEALHPAAARRSEPGGLAQTMGDAWEWTSSAYGPYPGFRPLPGAFGEYNGKFMVSQLVLRGGSCLTPREHARPTYRNFFPPSAAWQVTSVRLARDA